MPADVATHFRGRLQLLSLAIDGRPIAMKLNLFAASGGGFAFKIAYDEAYFVWTVNNQDVYGASARSIVAPPLYRGMQIENVSGMGGLRSAESVTVPDGRSGSRPSPAAAPVTSADHP